MVDFKLFQKMQTCLDDYMLRNGKSEINDMEANRELARVGLLHDSQPKPGSPLRMIFVKMRDSNILPHNIRQSCGRWLIKLSKSMANVPLVKQFQYC